MQDLQRKEVIDQSKIQRNKQKKELSFQIEENTKTTKKQTILTIEIKYIMQNYKEHSTLMYKKLEKIWREKLLKIFDFYI